MLNLPPSSDPASQVRLPLLGMTLSDVEAWLAPHGGTAHHARAIYSHVFARRATDFSGLQALSKGLRHLVQKTCDTRRPHVGTRQVSRDGTRKYGFVGTDVAAFEAVYIPEVTSSRRTNTLCISSQTGCAVGCKFCFTASITRHRDLTAAEIVGQVLAVRDDVAPLGEGAQVTNIVFMGMGEPLLNYDNVVQAVRVLLEPQGTDLSNRRVTISTSGIVPRMRDLGRDLGTLLAVSLNASDDATRQRIMPINKKWPLAELTAAMRAYPLRARRRITVEYVLLGGVNDSVEDARRLPALLAGIPLKMNLLPLNPHDRTAFTPPTSDAVARFHETLRTAGMPVFIRKTRGQDIAAACGQLGELA